jgi:hypothetical protein
MHPRTWRSGEESAMMGVACPFGPSGIRNLTTNLPSANRILFAPAQKSATELRLVCSRMIQALEGVVAAARSVRAALQQ